MGMLTLPYYIICALLLQVQTLGETYQTLQMVPLQVLSLALVKKMLPVLDSIWVTIFAFSSPSP